MCRSRIFIASIIMFVLFMCAVVTGAFGQQHPRVHTSNGDSIVAFDTACGWRQFNDALKQKFKGKAKNGLYVGVHVGDIAGCYVEHDGHLLFIFVDGDTYAVPVKEMKRGPIPTPGVSI